MLGEFIVTNREEIVRSARTVDPAITVLPLLTPAAA